MSPDSASISWLRVVLAFAVVFSLLALMGFVLKHVGSKGLRLPGAKSRGRRMAVVESLPLDARRRLVIVSCDGDEHLLLLGVGQDIVVDTSLKKRCESGNDA